LTQEKLAQRADMSVRSINQLETGGVADPHYSTLAQIADALGLSVVSLLAGEDYPKAEAPTSSLDVTDEERRSATIDIQAIEALIRRRLRRFGEELRDPNSPKFRTATTATEWLADVREEATAWLSLVLEGATTVAEGVRLVLFALGIATSVGMVEKRAQERIYALGGEVADFTAWRNKKACERLKDVREELEKRRAS